MVGRGRADRARRHRGGGARGRPDGAGARPHARRGPAAVRARPRRCGSPTAGRRGADQATRAPGRGTRDSTSRAPRVRAARSASWPRCRISRIVRHRCSASPASTCRRRPARSRSCALPGAVLVIGDPPVGFAQLERAGRACPPASAQRAALAHAARAGQRTPRSLVRLGGGVRVSRDRADHVRRRVLERAVHRARDLSTSSIRRPAGRVARRRTSSGPGRRGPSGRDAPPLVPDSG